MKLLFQLLIFTIFSPLNIKFPEKLPESSRWNVWRGKSRTCVQQDLPYPHEGWCSSCWIPWNVFLQRYFGQLLHWPNQQHGFLIDKIVAICRIISWSSTWWFYFFLYYCIYNISWVGSFFSGRDNMAQDAAVLSIKGKAASILSKQFQQHHEGLCHAG